MHEQRKHIRVNTPVIVQFPSPGTMKTVRSYTQDISESGMRLTSPVKLTVGQEIPITLQLPFNNDTMHATGEVMWVREISRHGPTQFEVGMRFRWVEDPDRQVLARGLSQLFQRRG